MTGRRIAIGAAAMCVAATAAGQDTTDARRHPSVQVGSALRVAFVARVQLDVNGSRLRGPERGRMLDLAQKRVGLEGRLRKSVRFRFDAEIDRRDPWRDAYLDYRPLRVMKVRAGRFKVPFSLDQNTPLARLDFTRRSRAATWLAPRRDQGVMLEGRLWRKRVTYEAGAFAGDRTTAVRVAAAPFVGHGAAGRFRAALAFTRGQLHERVERAYWVKGSSGRTGLEVQWAPGPVALAAEYIRTTDERLNQGVAGDDLPPLVADGWYVTGRWTIRAARRPAGRRVALAARVERLRTPPAGADANPRAAIVERLHGRAWTVGASVHLNPWVRLQADVTRERDRIERAGRAPRWSPTLRIQVGI